MFVLIVSKNAEDDIFQAANWYEQQRKGLGLDFILAVEAELSSISRNSLHYQELRLGYRRGIVKRFPYAIFYRMNRDSVVVVAVWHFSRKPWTWKRER